LFGPLSIAIVAFIFAFDRRERVADVDVRLVPPLSEPLLELAAGVHVASSAGATFLGGKYLESHRDMKRTQLFSALRRLRG
jgi:hypothetical protein